MTLALIEKFSRKKWKLNHLPIVALPIIAEEDVSLHSWKQKAAELNFLDQELDNINQKISQLQSTPPPEYIAQGRSTPPEKSISEKTAENRLPFVIEVSNDYNAVNPHRDNINDILEQLEQTALETGKIIRISPIREVNEEKEEVNFHYHSDNTLLIRLQSAIMELQKKWEETQQRLHTIKSAPPDVKDDLSRIDNELSRMRTFAHAQKGKIITAAHPLEHELTPNWKKIKQVQKIEKKAQENTQKVLDDISSQPQPYQEKLSAVDDLLSQLKRLPQQRVKQVTIIPENGHYSLSPKIKKRAQQEIKKLVKRINQEHKKSELSAIDHELSNLNDVKIQGVKIVTATPMVVHQFPPSSKIRKKVQKEVEKIMKNINQQPKSEELSAINAEIIKLDYSQPQNVKIITTAPLTGHHTIAPEIIKKARKEMKQILKKINQQQKQDQSLSKIDAELSTINNIPKETGKIIVSVQPLTEKTGVKKEWKKIKEKIYSIFKTHHTKESLKSVHQRTKQSHSKRNRKSQQSRHEELTKVNLMLEKLTKELSQQ